MPDAAVIQPIPSDNPIPQLPGGNVVVQPPKVQPGNDTTAAPTINALQMPQVNQNSQDFADITQAVQQIVASKKAELSAGQDTLVANTAIDRQVAGAIQGFQANTLTAYDNIKKIEQLPGGVKGGLSRILGLFDSDYNPSFQQTTIDENTARAQSITATGAALKEQNNQLPALLAKVSEAASTVYSATKDVNQLILQKGQLDVDRERAAQEAVRVRIEMTQEDRAQTDQKIRSLTTDQIAAELPRAEAGKGPFAGKAGLLQERLTTEQAAQASLTKALDEAQKGNREGYNENLADVVAHTPLDVSSALLQKAQSSGSPFVQYPTGQTDPATKQPQMINIPLDIVQQGIIKNQKLAEDANTAVAADMTNRLNIVPNMTNLANTANAFASVDPRATQIATQLGSIAKNFDPKNPASVQQFGIAIETLQKSMDKVTADTAARYSTPESKAAIIDYGKTGQFDTTGGAAVTADSIGNPSLQNKSLYKGAWQILGAEVAKQARAQNDTGAFGNLNPQNTADQQQIMAMLMGKTSGKQTIERLGQNALVDPAIQQQVSNSIKGTIQGSSIQDIVSGLAQQKGANPIWNDILQHPDQFKDQQGRPSASKLFEKFEQSSILSGGKIDYSNLFLTAMRNYASNADNSAASNPNYTLQDRALEAAIFGSSPHQNVLGDLHFQLRTLANRAHSEMDQRVQQDLSGQTVRQAIMNAAAIQGITDINGLMQMSPQQLFAKIHIDPNQVPSATGTGQTVNQVKAQYGNGQ